MLPNNDKKLNDINRKCMSWC